MVKQSPKEKILEQLRNLVEARTATIEQSTARKLERFNKEEAELRELLASIERVESTAKHSIPPSAEENELWTQIRRLSDEEASILRQRGVPERYVRADALEYFAGDLKQRREQLEASSQGMKFNQTHGPRVVQKFNDLAREEHTFATATKPLCIAGQRIFAIREEKRKLSEQRDALRLAREEKALANVG